MVEFNKCLNCGGEIAAGEEKCPVCGAAVIKNTAAAGENPGEAFEPPRPLKKSAFAPAPAGTVTAADYGCDRIAQPHNSIGCFNIIIFVIGFAVSFVVSILAALHFFELLYIRKIARVEIFSVPVIFSVVSFVVGTSFLGAALSYNFSAYIVAAEDYGRRGINFISMRSMALYYIAAFAVAVPFGLAASVVTEGTLFLSLTGLCALLGGAVCMKMTLNDIRSGDSQ